MLQNYINCQTKVHYVNAHVTLKDGMLARVIIPQQSGSAEVYAGFCPWSWWLCCQGRGCFVTEPKEESEEQIETVKRQQTPEVMPDDLRTFHDQTVSNDLVEHLENPLVELELEPDKELDWIPLSNILSLQWEKLLLRICRKAHP
ncbi:hypothetical protein LEMLEM_LOCUS17480 [Lemmus lemmus]